MNWSKSPIARLLVTVFTLAILFITRVVPFPSDTGATILLDDGGSAMVYGTAPRTGEIVITEYTNCSLWGLWCGGFKFTQTTDGVTITYQAYY